MTGPQLRAARIRLGMSHAQFARALGYSDRQSTARMEAGRRKVSKRAAEGSDRLLSILTVGYRTSKCTVTTRRLADGEYEHTVTLSK